MESLLREAVEFHLEGMRADGASIPAGWPAVSHQARSATFTRMTQTRPMPRRVLLPDWVWAVAFVSTLVGSGLTDTLWFILGLIILLLIQGIYVFQIVRCPACRGRLTFHQAFVPRSTRYRFQLACSRCQVIWDTGKIRDDDVFFNS